MEHMAGRAAVNGTHLYYEQAGSGQPLVLIHGFTLNTHTYYHSNYLVAPNRIHLTLSSHALLTLQVLQTPSFSFLTPVL